ncbi:hypothetical protein [Cohnella cellulosilytica]|uniref:Glycosyl hydrolase family 4 C-terminal domain-containing protein n=1 Tax=Cohnella cellulosilytica TaxID=986710 RepID=A0ABW2F4H7_9BACL
MYNICIIGSSLGWTPKLSVDLMTVFEEPLDIRLVDLDPSVARLCQEWGETATKHYGRQDKFTAYSDRRKALEGADAVIITISTGGLKTMEYDIAIPEKYGIYSTVGDTAGPSGWSRSMRNIPVFEEFARDFEEICPQAFIVNYTNPMSSLTATLSSLCGNPVVGLCHSYFDFKDVIQRIFKLEDWSPISLQIAGMNHFTWMTDFKVGRQDGYTMLRELVGTGSLRDVLPALDDKGQPSRYDLCAELYDTYGYMPYPGDRHSIEFLSYTLSGDVQRETVTDPRGYDYEIISGYNVNRTPVSERKLGAPRATKRLTELVSKYPENWPAELKKSEETGSNMVHAFLHNQAMTDVVNTLNVGQIPGLPLGACVETYGMIDGSGIRPVVVDKVPERLLELMRPQAMNQKWLTEGAVRRDKKLLLQALLNDPQCRHLTTRRIQELAEELFAANRPYISL